MINNFGFKNGTQEANIKQHTTRTSGSNGCSHLEKLVSSIFPEKMKGHKDMRFKQKWKMLVQHVVRENFLNICLQNYMLLISITVEMRHNCMEERKLVTKI